MWLDTLKQHFTSKKRTQIEAASSSLTADDTGELVSPISPLEDEDEFISRPKRRSVSIDISGARPEIRPANDRRTSLEQWHEARRARNSMEGQGTTTTDRLTVCKAGCTTIVNKTYITIKHLGSGTFGRVMLGFNVYDQRLYAIKICRKSQFAQYLQARSGHGRLRRSNQTGSYGNLQNSNSSACMANRSCTTAAPHCHSGPLSLVNANCGISSQPHVTNIYATSATVDVVNSTPVASAAAAAALLGSGTNVFTGNGCSARPLGPFHAASQVGWNPGQLQPPSPVQRENLQQQQQPQVLFGAQRDQQQQSKLRHSPVGAAELQRSGRAHSFGAAGAGPVGCAQFGLGPPGPLLSSGSTGWGSGLMGTDCSAGSMSGGSVFQEALMRFQTEELVKEIAILKKLNHPNIVNLVEVIDDPSTDSLLLVMEYVEGGTLQPQPAGTGRWEPLPEKDVWRYVREVLQGLDYLHYHKVVHGDLKPANLLLDSNSGKVKIADFGSSIITGGDKIFSMRNCPGFSTPAFRSPESLTSGYQPSFEMDMWALGVCIFMWVFGCLPFTGVAPFIIYEKIRGQDIYMPAASSLSPELKDFISQLLEKDALKRLDVLGAMQHPWVTLGGTAPLLSVQQQCFAKSTGSSGMSGPDVVVSQEEIDAAVRQIGGSSYEQMDVVFEEVHLSKGQELISPGDIADRIYLIARGEVEIVAGGSAQLAAHEPLVTGLDVDLGDAQHDSSELWDTMHVADISKDPGTTSMMLLCDVLSPWDSSSSHTAAGAAFRLLAVKGPGDSLGVPMPPSDHQGPWQQRERRWKVHVRARGSATVFTARVTDLEKLVEAHPEMESAVKQIVTQQETDMMVAEAMRQLRLYNDCAHAHLPGSECPADMVVTNL